MSQQTQQLAQNFLEIMETNDIVNDFRSRSGPGDNCSLSKDQETFLVLSQENMKIMEQKLAEAYAIIEWQRSKIWHQEVEIENLKQENQGLKNNLEMATNYYVFETQNNQMANATIAEQKAEIEGLKQENKSLINELVVKNEIETSTGSEYPRFFDQIVGANYRNESTQLHIAAKRGNFENVKWLLENGAQVNVQDALHQCTPLHYAAKNGHYEIVEILLNYGANKYLRNESEVTPLEEAEESFEPTKYTSWWRFPDDYVENLRKIIELLK